MRLYLFLIAVLPVTACHSKNDSPVSESRLPVPNPDPADTAGNFFPVTAYLKGEIAGIKRDGITPFDKIKTGNHTDSFWLNTDAKMQAAFADFISPLIDTVNLKKTFTEKRFKDETLNAYTFTCDPVDSQADSFAFRHWDVYIDPESNKVTRIYLLKQIPGGRQLQLTWQSGKWCKIVMLKTNGDNTEIEKEEKISWAYDKE